jgi:hypothetical protein
MPAPDPLGKQFIIDIYAVSGFGTGPFAIDINGGLDKFSVHALFSGGRSRRGRIECYLISLGCPTTLLLPPYSWCSKRRAISGLRAITVASTMLVYPDCLSLTRAA